LILALEVVFSFLIRWPVVTSSLGWMFGRVLSRRLKHQ
jgi:hypothetical protein